jgi:uncharacterized membrane protein
MLLSALAPLAAAFPLLGTESSSPWQGQTDEPQYQDGQETYNDIYLYFHRTASGGGQYVLNTQGGSNGVDILPSAETVTFRLESPLTKSLLVEGHEVSPTQKGFWLDLSVNAVPSATVTIEVLDEDTAIANETRTISSESRWTIPFIGSVTSYTFQSGHRIGLRITTTGSTTINYGDGGKLWVLCDPVSLSADTYNAAGLKVKTFYPNDIGENRHVVVRGKIMDAWGADDIASVFVDIMDPGGMSIVNTTAEITGMNFTYDWNYSQGQQAGTYSVLVSMNDQQGNPYSTTTDFTMATYGVYLDSPQSEEAGIITGSVEVDGCIEYTVSVLNIGAVGTSYTVSQSTSDVDGWTLTVVPSQTGTVQPGESVLVTVKVCADDSVEEGTGSVFWVQAVAVADPTAKDTIQVITSAVPKIHLTIAWTTASNSCTSLVPTGGSVNCSFEVKNSGLESLNVTISDEMQKGAPDWTWSVTPASIMNTNLVMHPEQTVAGTLNIIAPSDPSSINETIIDLSARTSDVDPPLRKSITAKVVMSTGINLELMTADTVTVDVSDKSKTKYANFEILVTNTDPNNDHTIVMSAVEPPQWEVEFMAGNSVFSLRPDESLRVTVKVTPHEDAISKTHPVEITGMYQDNPQTWDQVDVNVAISAFHDLAISSDYDKLEVGFDEDAEFEITVTNNGNVDEKSVFITVRSGDDDFKASVSVGNGTDLVLNIDRGKSETFTVKIKPKEEMKHKDKGEFTVQAKPTQGNTVQTTVKVQLDMEMQDRIPALFRDAYIPILIVLFIVVLVLFGAASKHSKKKK